MTSEKENEIFIEKFYDSSLRKEDTPFTQIYNFVVQNLLHHESLVIWLYLQTKPKTWIVNRKEISSHFIGMGREKIEKCFAILKRVGLIEIYSIRESGKIVGWETYIKCGIGCEQKILEFKKECEAKKEKNKTKKIVNSTDNQNTENQCSGKKVKIPHKQRAEEGIHQNTENTGSGKSVDIERKKIQKERKKLQEKINKKEKSELKMIDPNYTYPETYYPMNPKIELTETEDDSFNVFWKIYPIKKNKEKVKKAWKLLGCSSIANEIINKLMNQVKQDSHFIDGYCPMPEKYLVERRWEDDIFTRKTTKTTLQPIDHEDDSWARGIENDLL